MKHYWLAAVAVIGSLGLAQAQPAADAQTNSATGTPFEWGPGIKVLIATGGHHHDFAQWFTKTDSETLQRAGITSVHSTEDEMVAIREMPHIDVLLMSANSAEFDLPVFRQALTNYVKAGKGVVLVHTTVFYWGSHEFNPFMVGGGAHDHDGVSPFDETIIKEHPVTRGLPPTFQITDELYHEEVDPNGQPQEVLAVASRPGGQKYNSVWIVHNGNARIVCCALGHDGSAHNSPEFQKLLVNAVNWAGGH